MEQARFQYEAFISYRHREPDATVARWVEKELETYRIPLAVRKAAGRARLMKLFRDQDELPLCADLGEGIDHALRASKWLIVICTPALLESKWCMREVETFLALGRREYIIPVLVEGTPATSFPEAIRFETTDAGRIEREPLAANVAADTAAARRKKLKTEKLRLIARMLNVGYDDLARRYRERKLRALIFGATAAAVLLGAFGVYALIQNNRIEEKRVLATGNEALMLVEKSTLSVKDQNKADARALALSAYHLTQTIGGAHADEALRALAAASYLGDMEAYRSLDSIGMNLYDLSYSPDGRYVAGAMNRNTVCCFFTESGKKAFTAVNTRSEIAAPVFSRDGECVIAACLWENAVHVYGVSDGELRASYHTPDAGDSAAVLKSVSTLPGTTLILKEGARLTAWDYATGAAETLCTLPDAYDFMPLTVSENAKIGLVSNQAASGRMPLLVSLETGAFSELTAEGDIRTYRAYAVSPDGETVACAANERIDLFHAADGTMYRSIATGGQITDALCFSPSGDKLLVVCGDEATATLFSAASGDASIVIPEAKSCIFSADGMFLVADGARLYDAQSGALRFDGAEAGMTIRAFSPDGASALVAGGENISLCAMPGKGTQTETERYEGTLTEIPNYSPLNRECMLTNSYDIPLSSQGNAVRVAQSRMYVSPNGRFAVVANEFSYVGVWDLDKGDELAYRIYENVAANGVCWDVAFSEDGRYMVTAGQDGRCVLFDLEAGETVMVANLCVMQYTLTQVKLNRAGDVLIAKTYAGDRFYVYDLKGNVPLYTLTPFSPVADFGFDAQTGNAVLVYETGGALIAEIFSETSQALSALAR